MPTTTAPLGSPLGVDTPVQASVPPSKSDLSRYIDPNNGTYRIDPETGVYGTMPTVRQQVLLALVTELGSSTVLPELGFKIPRKLGRRSLGQVQDSVRRALRHLRALIRIERIELERTGAGRAEITVEWADVSTGEADEVTF